MKRFSIGSRLTLWYLVVFTLAQIVFATGMWLSLRHHLYAMVDDNLRDEVADLGTLLQAQKPDASQERLRDEVAESYAEAGSGEFLELSDERGNLIFQSPTLREHPIDWGSRPTPRSASFQNQDFNGQHLRFITTWLTVRDRHYMVHFGLSTRQVHGTLGAFFKYLWIVGSIVFVGSALGGYWLSRRALAPVDRLTRTARTITGNSLGSRVERLHTGDELQRLSDTLNEMLDRIEAAFRRITEFTADASHELRTPVSLIRTEAELALRRSRTPEEYRASLEHILAEAERTTGLLEQLLAIARTDAGRESLEVRPLDLRDLVQQAAAAWESVLRSRKMEFVSEVVPAEPAAVAGDGAALRRVLDILLDNASKYTPEGGRVELRLTTEEGYAAISVSDSGIGIPDEEQQRIFERFYRVDKVRSRSLGGAGLGLSIARWIAQQHGGTIEVQSAPGRGSSFVVRIPLAPEATRTPGQAVAIT